MFIVGRNNYERVTLEMGAAIQPKKKKKETVTSFPLLENSIGLY